MAPRLHRLRSLVASFLGAGLVSGVGLLLVWGQKLADRSYDLPFLFRSPLSAPELEIVYLDEHSRNSLQQTNVIWDRSLYTQLLRVLIRNEASLVFFDITFEQPGDPMVDQELAKEIGRAHV